MAQQTAIKPLKSGDIRGLEHIVARHQVKAVRTADLITRDAGLAEDVVQDTFLQVYRSIRGFDAARPFEPWFMRSVVNASVKFMQRSTRQVEVGDDTDETVLAELVSRAESVEEQVESIEIQNQIWEAMQRLSP